MQKQVKITKALFPVAGLGTRFLPATKAQPKEMLPIVDKPLIQYAVEEAYAAGIRHMIFVTGRNKRAIEDHFDTAYELECELEAAHKEDLLRMIRAVQPNDMDCSYVRQSRTLGLGHAVLCAEHLIGDEPFAVLLADDLMVSRDTNSSVLGQMVKQFEDLQSSILAIQAVPLEHTKRYGIIAGDVVRNGLHRINRIIEKPEPNEAPSCMAVAGRYILTPAVFNKIRSQPRGKGGELQLTDGIAALLSEEKVYAFEYAGKRYDCGTKEGFLAATVELALLHPVVGESFREYLRGVQLEHQVKSSDSLEIEQVN